jgi:Zn-dependent protease
VSAYRDYDNSPLMQFVRFVTKSFSIGTFFGVHVRMYWAAAILMPLLFLRWASTVSVSVAEAMLLMVLWFVGLFLVVWTHEMGHIAAGWRFRIRTDLITLSPLGGLAHMNAPASTPRAELLISLAGPAVHLLWLVVFWPLQLLLPDYLLSTDGFLWRASLWTVWYLVGLNQAMLVFNLLPVFPLDGGRCLRALLAMRVHPNRATMWATTVGMVGGGVLCLLAFTRSELHSAVLLVIGLSCISASLNERRMARHVLVYQQSLRDPWAADPDAWKHGGDPQEPRRRGPGWFTRWRRARGERRAAQAAAEAELLDREVDAILERVHQVGMSGLSDKEKAVLKRASQRRRGTG